MRTVALASLTFLGSLLLSSSAAAQPLPPPPDQGGQPQPPPPDPGMQPAPGQPGMQQPPPGQPGMQPDQPGMQPGMQQPPPGQPGAGAGGEADASWQFETDFTTGGDAGPPPNMEELELQWRRQSLKEQNSLSGSTGLLRVTHAGSGADGTFRVGFLASWFTAGGFLCDGSHRCADPPDPSLSSGDDDDVNRVGAHMTISATLFPFMEAYMGLHSQATSNNFGTPQLLQVLGDTDIGLKFFMPKQPDQIFGVGGEAQLWLLNGTGGVGLDGSGTSFAIRALGTADLSNQMNPDDQIPLRISLNAGYMVDRSGNLVEETETNRGRPITRIERFGLDINRVDSFQLGLGVEGMFDIIRPFVEWTADVPVNSRDYVCNLDTVDPGDGCLGNNAGFTTTPSRITLGARVYPWFDGLALQAAADIGTGATSEFIEEVAPEPPWNLYFGLAYGFDTQTPEPIIREMPVERVVQLPPPPEHYIQGGVVDKKSREPVANAVIRYEGRDVTGMVTGADGRFRTVNLEPGAYTFAISAEGYRDGQCQANIPAGMPAGQPGQFGQPGMGPEQQPGMGPGQPGMMPPPGQPGMAPPPGGGQPGMGQPGMMPPGGQPEAGAGGPVIINVECELESLPKVGNVVGTLVNAESGASVASASVKITDKLNRELELQADQTGAFRFENVPPGPVKITVTADGYLPSVTELEVEPRQDVKASISLNEVPARQVRSPPERCPRPAWP